MLKYSQQYFLYISPKISTHIWKYFLRYFAPFWEGKNISFNIVGMNVVWVISVTWSSIRFLLLPPPNAPFNALPVCHLLQERWFFFFEAKILRYFVKYFSKHLSSLTSSGSFLGKIIQILLSKVGKIDKISSPSVWWDLVTSFSNKYWWCW